MVPLTLLFPPFPPPAHLLRLLLLLVLPQPSTQLVLAIGVALGWQSGYAINPARDLGPRILTSIAGWGGSVFTHRDYYFLVPLCCPFAGALLGGAVYKTMICQDGGGGGGGGGAGAGVDDEGRRRKSSGLYQHRSLPGEGVGGGGDGRGGRGNSGSGFTPLLEAADGECGGGGGDRPT